MGKLNNCTLGWMAREIRLSRDFFVQRLVLWHEAALSLKLLKSACREDSKAVPVSSVQLLSRVWLFVTPWTAAHQASLSTNFRSLPKLMFIESVMPSNHLILCHPLLLPPSIFPSIRVFQMSQFFASGGQSIGVSASTSVLCLELCKTVDIKILPRSPETITALLIGCTPIQKFKTKKDSKETNRKCWRHPVLIPS